MWIDAHIHLYDTRRTTVCWPGKELGLPESVYVPDFLRVAGASGIHRMVSVECTVGGPEEVDNWTLTLTRNDPAVAAVIACGDMTSPEFGGVHGRYSVFPKYRGIRMGAIPEEKMGMFSENLTYFERGEANVTELLMEPGDMLRLLPVIRAHRSVRFVLNHLPGCTCRGEPQSGETLDFLREMGREENVFMKVSSFVTKADKPAPDTPESYLPAFRAAWDAFGREKLIYGSDWPVLNFKGTYACAVRAILGWLRPMGEDITDDVMGRNCERVYGVKDV